MSGTIPEEIYDNENLEWLRLDNNAFSGTISSRVCDLTSLADLRLNNNSLTGTLSPFFFSEGKELGTHPLSI